MHVWNVLHAARWKYGTQKNHHLRTIAQLCRAVSSHLRHVLTIWRKLVTQQYLPHMPLQYGELRPTNGWDLLASLGHPSKFQRVSRLGSSTARHCSSGRQPNFAALNRGCHLYWAGWPSRWALAHILVLLLYFDLIEGSVIRPSIVLRRQKYTHSVVKQANIHPFNSLFSRTAWVTRRQKS